MPHIFRSQAEGAAPDAVPVGEVPVSFGEATLWNRDGVFVLFAPPRVPVLVNGRPVPAGIRVLAHRDQIHAGSEVWWFSAEDPSCVEAFPGGAGDLCPRCQQRIAAEAPAVRCGCGNWFHQTAKLPCFSYAAECPVCHRPTSLDGTPALSPEE